MSLQLRVSLLVSLRRPLVPLAVKLDGNLGGRAEKIEDVRPPWMLAAKLEIGDLPVS